jgi:hypothetical protein
LRIAKVTTNMREGVPVAFGGSGTRIDRNPIALEAVEEVGDRDPARIDGTAALHFRNQPSAFNLRLPLSTGERMPAALALAGCVLRVNHDCPTTGRAFADVAFHFDSPSSESECCCAA